MFANGSRTFANRETLGEASRLRAQRMARAGRMPVRILLGAGWGT
jgi:hypothetical protein